MPKIDKAERRDLARERSRRKPKAIKSVPKRKLERLNAAHKDHYLARQSGNEADIADTAVTTLRHMSAAVRKAPQLKLDCLICGRALPGKTHWKRCKPDRALDQRVFIEVFGRKESWQRAEFNYHSNMLGWTTKEVPYYSTNRQAAQLVVEEIWKRFGTDLLSVKDPRTICLTALSLVTLFQ